MNQPVKKPYSKPTITQIPLKAEEAVLTACKQNPSISGVNTCNPAQGATPRDYGS
jgi:hypothetical protein